MSARDRDKTAISPSAVKGWFDNVIMPDFEKRLVCCGVSGCVRKDDEDVRICAYVFTHFPVCGGVVCAPEQQRFLDSRSLVGVVDGM